MKVFFPGPFYSKVRDWRRTKKRAKITEHNPRKYMTCNQKKQISPFMRSIKDLLYNTEENVSGIYNTHWDVLKEPIFKLPKKVPLLKIYPAMKLLFQKHSKCNQI